MKIHILIKLYAHLLVIYFLLSRGERHFKIHSFCTDAKRYNEKHLFKFIFDHFI